MSTTSPPPPSSEGATVEPFPCGTACTVGLRVMHVDRFHLGTVRFIGTVRGAPSKGPMLGVEWDKPEGLNDGSRAGTVYFTCKPKHGSFLAVSKVMPPQLLDDVLTERYTMTASSTRGIGNDPRVREEGTGAFINVKSCDCSASASLAVAGRVSPQFPALFPHLADLSITDALFVDWEPIKTLCTGLKFLVRLNIRGNKVGSLDKFLTSLAPSCGSNPSAAAAICDNAGACDDDVGPANDTSMVMWSSSMETFNAASTGVTSDCFPHFFTLFPKLKSLHVGFNELTELRTPKLPSSITAKPSDHISSKKTASTETETVAKQGSLNDETTKKTATSGGESDIKTFHLQDLILDTNKFTSLSTLASQLGPVLCSTIQTLNVNNNPIENVEHRCDGLPSTMPAPGVDTGIPTFRKFVRCADAIKSMDSVSSSPDGRAASTTSGKPNSTSGNSGDENEDRGEGGDGQNGKNGDSPSEGEIPKGMVRNPLTEAQHVAQFCFSQKHSLFPALSSLLMRDSAVKAWDDLIPLFDLPLIREVCFSSATLCGKIASRENRRRVVIAMLPPHLTRLNQSFITKKERESARYHVVNEWILQEQEEAQLAACATPLEPNLPPAARASDNTNENTGETASAPEAATSTNSANSAVPKATFEAAVHKSVQAFQRILMEDRGGSTAETEIFIPTKKLLETHFDVTVHVVFGTPRPVQALFAQYFLPLVLSSNQPSADGGGAGGVGPQLPNISPGRFVGASGDSVQSSLNEDKARKKSTLPTAFAELAVNRASVEDLLAGAQPSAPPPGSQSNDAAENPGAQSAGGAAAPVCATTSGMRGGDSSVDVGAVWHAQFDGECHIKMDVATLKRNIIEQYVIVARRMLPDGHPQKLTGSASPNDASSVDNSASSASSAVHGLKPSDGLLVFLLDHELMENPGAIRQGFFCKEMFPDSALLRNWRMASGHHVVVCVVDGGKAMLSRAPNASAVTALCSF